MVLPFLYDTHYQVDKPFAFLDLTLATASPTEHASDDILARRLEKKAKAQVVVNDKLGEWKPNLDQMRYWIGNCHDANLLSRQNSYDYWLMNFWWLKVFSDTRQYWGHLRESNATVARLLLLRWGWLFDAPMLLALSWQMHKLETWDVGELLAPKARYVEEALTEVFGAVRDSIADPRQRTVYRQKIEEISRGFKQNTRRHKVSTHLAILNDTGLLKTVGPERSLHPGLVTLLSQFSSLKELIAASLSPGGLGRGSALFLDLVERTFELRAKPATDLDEVGWAQALNDVRDYWKQIEQWDRKFLGIRALAELFLVRNLAGDKPLWTTESWQTFLTQRARYVPEELTVHVDRFGRVEYLRLTSAS